MNMKRTILPLIAALAVACTGEEGRIDTVGALRQVEINLRIMDGYTTKGVPVNEGLLSDLNIYIYNSYGDLQYHSFNKGLSFTMNMWSNMKYECRLVANAGIDLGAISLKDLEAKTFTAAGGSVSGPSGQVLMSGAASGITTQNCSSITVPMTRCVARINVRADISRLTNTSITFSGVYLHDVTNFTGIFGTSKAVSASQTVYDGDSVTGSSLSGLTTSGVDLYCFQNAQGVLLPGNSSPSLKVLDNIPYYTGLCTYLELVGQYEGPDKHGTVCYRMFLGGDAYRDFSLENGKRYDIVITFKGDALSETSWRVDTSLLEDNMPKVADFFYSDGSWSSTLDGKKKCIGIVFDVDGKRNQGNQIWVCALQSTSRVWSTLQENISGVTTTDFYAYAEEDIEGKANTNAIGMSSRYSKDTYPAAYFCLNYSTDGFPAGSWSMGALKQIASLYSTRGASDYSPASGTVSGSIKKAGGATLYSEYGSSSYVWSSTMASAQKAYSENFGFVSPNKKDKTYNGYVRPILQL